MRLCRVAPGQCLLKLAPDTFSLCVDCAHAERTRQRVHARCSWFASRGVREHDTIVNDPDLMNRRGERVRMDIDDAQAVDVVLQPGEMSLHHTNIVHGSNPNGSDGPRIGFIMRFVTSQTNEPRSAADAGTGRCGLQSFATRGPAC